MKSTPSKGSPPREKVVLMTLDPTKTREERLAIFREGLKKLGVPIKPSTNPQPPSD